MFVAIVCLREVNAENVTEEIQIIKIKIKNSDKISLIINKTSGDCWTEDGHQKIKVYGDDAQLNRWLAAFINAKNTNDGKITIIYDDTFDTGYSRSSCKCQEVIIE